MTQRWNVRMSLLAVLTALVVLTGCAGGEQAEDAAHGEAGGGAEPAVIEISEEAAAILARADLADGTEDHVVRKCASCNLAMDGSPDHALQVGEYEMHFCTSTCSRRFKEATEASILAMAQP